MQDQGNGLQPLAFLSRWLKPTEQRYSVYERELAIVTYCLQSWRHYLEGCPGGVTVVTDHQPLVRLMDQQVLTRVQIRWLRLGLLQSIRPTIKYQPGKANVVADALSWSQRKETEDSMDDPMATAVAVEEHVATLSGFNVELTAEDLQTWTKAYKEDKSHVAAYKATPGTKVSRCILASIWSSGQDGGGSTKDNCSSVFATKYIEGMPRCALHRPCGHAQDLGTGNSTGEHYKVTLSSM